MRTLTSGVATCLVFAALSLTACKTNVSGWGDTTVDENAMSGFSWVIDGQVAGMPRPGASRPLEQDLQFLQEQGVDVLVSLTEQPVDSKALAAHEMEGLHLPVADFHAPTQDQLDTYVSSVKKWTDEGRAVGTHCAAGLGRTGTFLAALFVSRGMNADEAIAAVRKLRPGSIETTAQENAVHKFAERQAEKRVR
ncbi:MAG: dual specificity protein phosphatase family protein [Polyangiaceae bacterium]|nr:dual specificity protein phosphatase family protein [Polyangiaceae bacterium]